MDMKAARAYKTSLHRALRNVIRNKHIKGLVVGYPLDQDHQPTRHCRFIEEFLDGLGKARIAPPVTLINEYGTSLLAKAKLAERVMGQKLLADQESHQVITEIQQGQEQLLDPQVMLRKGIYDKLAAEVILKRFLDFYNSDSDQLIVNRVK